ncbi:uncharacterized protein TNIN_295151 [Trichonephila inaurata madagascariensis]|uniref:Ig-like domain-containing protein n=1 Tax=Trichonephila inaurata madagascariensis TaxID=2747483 RepID=A0A8X6YVD2_9ARAC|nr:uncharacterized protein TNIN_295151 [Trichonephila inaurata madagascariensis]
MNVESWVSAHVLTSSFHSDLMITKRIGVAPIVNISLIPSSSHQESEKAVTFFLECSIWANPWIFEIAWQFEDRPIVDNLLAGIIISNQTLIIQNVKKDHRGRYRCHAANIVGHGYSKRLHLLVQFTPVCKSREPKTYGISVSETVNATCEVEADPQEVSYRWSLDSPLGTLVLSNWSSAPHRGSLNYSPLTGNGYGTLLCWGRNSVGTQKEPCLVNIVLAGEESIKCLKNCFPFMVLSTSQYWVLKLNAKSMKNWMKTTINCPFPLPKSKTMYPLPINKMLEMADGCALKDCCIDFTAFNPGKAVGINETRC